MEITRKRGAIHQNSINAGGAIVLVIFVVLCLTIFGLLSFATAFADKRLSDKNVSYVALYYRADAAAEKILAEIYGCILADEDFPFNDVDFFYDNGEITVRYTVQIDAMQSLSCEVSFYYENGSLNYSIEKWQVILTGELDYGGGRLDVWDGSLQGGAVK